jgi:hypothetical protein
MFNQAKRQHQAPEDTTSHMLLHAIAPSPLDERASLEGESLMAEALHHGVDLVATFKQQWAIARATGNHSRLHGAMKFLSDELERRTSDGVMLVAPSGTATAIEKALYLPPGLRRNAIALLPRALEEQAVQCLCRLVTDSHKAPTRQRAKPSSGKDVPVPDGMTCPPMRHAISPNPNR